MKTVLAILSALCILPNGQMNLNPCESIVLSKVHYSALSLCIENIVSESSYKVGQINISKDSVPYDFMITTNNFNRKLLETLSKYDSEGSMLATISKIKDCKITYKNNFILRTQYILVPAEQRAHDNSKNSVNVACTIPVFDTSNNCCFVAISDGGSLDWRLWFYVLQKEHDTWKILAHELIALS